MSFGFHALARIAARLFDSASKLALDKSAAFPNLRVFNSGRVFLKDEIDSLNVRGLLGGICLRL
jgi:hypothetical protein